MITWSWTFIHQIFSQLNEGSKKVVNGEKWLEKAIYMIQSSSCYVSEVKNRVEISS